MTVGQASKQAVGPASSQEKTAKGVALFHQWQGGKGQHHLSSHSLAGTRKTTAHVDPRPHCGGQ